MPVASSDPLESALDFSHWTDFIVALKSVEVDCDVELRQMLYPLFGIELDSCR